MPNNYFSVLYKHIIQVGKKSVGAQTYHCPPYQKSGGTCPPCCPPPPASYASVKADYNSYIYSICQASVNRNLIYRRRLLSKHSIPLYLSQISNGPTYNLKVVGVGVTPSVVFSFENHDFGICFVHKAGMPEYSTVLEITNKDQKEIRYIS